MGGFAIDCIWFFWERRRQCSGIFLGGFAVDCVLFFQEGRRQCLGVVWSSFSLVSLFVSICVQLSFLSDVTNLRTRINVGVMKISWWDVS